MQPNPYAGYLPRTTYGTHGWATGVNNIHRCLRVKPVSPGSNHRITAAIKASIGGRNNLSGAGHGS
jgi:hypothetical protein